MYKKTTMRTWCMGLMLLAASGLHAEGWLPKSKNPNVKTRLLSCHYDKAQLVSCTEIDGQSKDWSVTTTTDDKLGGTRYIFEARRAMKSVGVAVATDCYDWCSDRYVMIPSVVYNGNRQRIVNREYATGLDKTDYYRRDLALTSNPIPQLSPDFGAPSRIEVNVSNTSTPVITYYDRRRQEGTMLFTDQGIEWKGEVKDHAFIIEESADRSMATMVISAPGVRERKPEFIGFSKSPDRGIDVQAGDKIEIRVARIDCKAADVPTFLSRFMAERKLHTVAETPRDLMPMSEVLARMVRNIDERYYVGDQWQYYCPENADWMSYGWIGGLMNTYPMLALGDATHLEKVCHTFDFGLGHGAGASGYFYDVVGKDGKVIFRDGAREIHDIALTRKNADILYWMVKQMMLLKRQGKGDKIAPEWEARVKQLADAFVATWKKEGTWGNYVNAETGSVAVFNTTGGAMAVGGLALAASYYNHPRYMEVARAAAKAYYDNFALVGFTSGGCGDILQNADSETAIALTTSIFTLYETTQDATYLEQAAHLAALCATWTVSFPYRLPEDTPLAKLGANLTGAVWASTQNKHGAPGFCTQSGDVLFKLYRATGNTLFAELIRDVIHGHAEGVQPNGKITERLTYCDADSRGSRLDGGKTGWNETNGALMAIEIPGIYVRTDLAQAYVFDHVKLNNIQKSRKGITLTLQNPTEFDAVVTIFAENGEEAKKPLGDNAFVNWTHKVKIPAHKTVKTTIK